MSLNHKTGLKDIKETNFNSKVHLHELGPNHMSL